MPGLDPEADVAALVATATGRTLGQGLLRGKVLAVEEGTPPDCIFVSAHRGERPMPLLGTGTTVWSSDVEVTVRGPAGDREAARQTARGLLYAVQQATRTGLEGYALALVVDGEPEDMEQDTNQSHSFSFALTVQWVG